METGGQTKKFPFGDSPFPNRVCSHLAVNIYINQTGEKGRSEVHDKAAPSVDLALWAFELLQGLDDMFL